MKPFNSHGQSFTEIPVGSPNRSSFNKSYTHKSSGRLGKIQPIHCKEVLPSAKFNLDPTALLRFEPMAVPMLSSVHQRIHNYVVPFRQVWSNFETFITRGKSQTEDLQVPSTSLDYICGLLESRFKSFCSSFYSAIEEQDEPDNYLRTLYYKWVQDCLKVNPTIWSGLDTHFPWSRCSDSLGTCELTPYGTAESFNLFSSFLGDFDVTGSFDWLLDSDYVMFSLNNYVSDVKGEQGKGAILCMMLSLLFVVYMYYFHEDIDSDNVLNYDGDDFFGYIGTTYTNDIIRYELRDKIISLAGEISSLILPAADSSSRVRSQIDVQTLQSLVARCFYETLIEPFLGTSSEWSYLGYPIITQDEWIIAHTFVAVYQGDSESLSRDVFNYIPFFTFGLTLTSQLLGHTDVMDNEVFADSMHAKLPKIAGKYVMHIFDRTKLSILPLRALYRIWWYNYRDQRIESDCLDPDTPAFKADTSSDIDLITLLLPRYIAWAKDTFTTATLNSYSSNIIVPLDDEINFATIPVQVNDVDDYGDIVSRTENIAIPRSCLAQGNDIPREGISGLSLSMLRKCQALASWLDKNMFIGYQYADQLYSHYAVKYSDARLQIPEYIGGTSEVVAIDVITNNTNTADGDGNIVDVAGRQSARMQGVASAHTKGYFSEEHALCISLMSILPESSHPDAIDRSLFMQSTFDIAFPEFAQTGSDIVSTGEVAFNPFALNNNVDPFGYQGRYYHYKSNVDRISGNLRTSRKEFTYARFFLNPEDESLYLKSNVTNIEKDESMFNYEDKYYTRPYLSPSFIHCLAPTYMFVSKFDDQFVCDMHINLTEQLPLPVYDEVL